MAGIADVVTVNITTNSRTPTRAGFGTPLFMGYHTKFPERYRIYTDLPGMVSDGFETWSAQYLWAQALMAQNPRVEKFVIGRLPAAHTHTQTVTILTAVEGQHIRLSVMSPTDGTVTEIDYTILAAETTTTVATAVELLIEAVTGVDASSAVAVITVIPTTPGGVVYLYEGENVAIKDTTADAGYDDELTALQAVYDDWYGVNIDTASEANIDLVAAWAETRTKLFFAGTFNTEEADGTGTMASQLEALAYDRTILLWGELFQYPPGRWLGRGLPKDPGSITWAFKELVGMAPSALTPTQETNLHGNNVNTYQTIAGLGITRKGVSVSGEFIDIVHGIDWLTARLQERILAILANADKISYEDASVDMFAAEILAQLEEGVARKFLKAGTLFATGPKVADVALADRAARLLPDMKFGADIAGAVHKVKLDGTLSI